jgi:SAM-dependent methyltransferase
MSNDEMIRYWNEAAGPVWVSWEEQLDAQLAPIGRGALARAGLRAGDRVLDVGCGCGGTVLDVADAVGPTGRVVGVDISKPMLDRAAQRVARAGFAERVTLRCEDAQTAAFAPASFERIVSRFGVMFFADPVAAFANLRRALVPGGSVTFVCWQAREKNPWMMAPARAAAAHVAFPAPPPPDAPGPFAFADADRARGILDAAGFTGFAAEAVDGSVAIGGGSLDDALELMLAVGPIGAALREAKPSEEQRAKVLSAVRGVLESFQTPRGLEAPAGWWIVTADNPA